MDQGSARSRSTPIRKGRAARAIHASTRRKQLRAPRVVAVTVTAKAGTGGRLFGAITPADVAAAVKAVGGPELDKRKVEVVGHIKTTGTYQATVRLHPDVQATLDLQVVAAS